MSRGFYIGQSPQSQCNSLFMLSKLSSQFPNFIVRDVIWVQIFPVDFSYWSDKIAIANFVSISTQIVLRFEFFYAQGGGKGIFVILH